MLFIVFILILFLIIGLIYKMYKFNKTIYLKTIENNFRFKLSKNKFEK